MRLYTVKRLSDGMYASTYMTISVNWVELKSADFKRSQKEALELIEYCSDWLGKPDQYIVEIYDLVYGGQFT